MMQKYIGSDITSMVTLPVVIFEPMTMLQKMAAEEEEEEGEKMIYRKWSLLSGPPVILGGAVIAAVAVGFVLQNVTKGEQKKNVSTNK
jgi:hypothetical protein